jgi:hypothetical protein
MVMPDSTKIWYKILSLVKKRFFFVCMNNRYTATLYSHFFFSSIGWMQNTINDQLHRNPFHVPTYMSVFHWLGHSKWFVRPRFLFYGKELLAHRSTPNLEDHPLSAACIYLLNKFVATLHIYRLSPLSASWGPSRSRLPRAYEAYKCTHLVNYILCYS